ncbi:MAG TPA: tail fiber domain-containing protein [Steroidobacteraceae bacterium]|nr:tail fiber domain-containing protein [Steroidobacteraceae bacterium]
MNTLWRNFIGLTGALAVAGAAYAQVPSTNDTSTTDGNNNTGMGTGALGGPSPANLTGSDNTASGAFALSSNTTGSFNTAVGFKALVVNTSGSNNSATGLHALWSNTTGSENTANGVNTLLYNTTGSDNTALGVNALFENTSGHENTASGYQALYKNKTGADNTAAGMDALYANTSGHYNTASGYDALRFNTTGEYNTALGWEAGYNLTTGSNNIDIGNPGDSTDGVAADSGIIRIGTSLPSPLQTATYIAGIYGASVSGSPVYVASNGQLGTVVSSERFKTAIMPMGSETAKLLQLRPVTFKLKSDAKGARQYGLIAEEVAKVYPELVIRDQSGRIDGVRYDELAPMLLNEVQQQAAEIRDLKELVVEMHAGLLKLQAKDSLVAQR